MLVAAQLWSLDLGSYVGGDESVCSDLDVTLNHVALTEPQQLRLLQWSFEFLPRSCYALVFILTELEELLYSDNRMVTELHAICVCCCPPWP